MSKIYWTGDVGYRNYDGEGITPASVKEDLAKAGGADIEVELSTFGGNFFDGVAILDLLRGYKGKKVGCGSSIVASAGTLISLGFDEFYVRPTTMFMIHNAQGFTGGDHNQMREDADLYERLSNLAAEEYAKRTGKKVEEIKAMMDKETWLIGQEIVDAGFAEGLVDDEEEDEDLNTSPTMALLMAQKQFRDRVTMWAKNPKEKADAGEAVKAQVEAMITAGSFDKLAPVPTDAELSIDKYPIAKNGTVFRSSLRAISARAAKENPELAKWATAMIAKIDAKGEIRVNKEAVLGWLKDNPGCAAEVAAVMGLTLATQEHTAAVSMLANLKAQGIADPVAHFATMKADLERVETDKVSNALDAQFGPAKNADGTENTLRSYAALKLAGVKSADLAAKVEEFKNDALAVKLAGERMDVNAEVNIFGKSEREHGALETGKAVDFKATTLKL